MSLKVTHNRAEHTHENIQFRRVSSALKQLFEKKDWNGLLIGNPFNEDYSRFRADALLFYNHGVIIIDFKDYRGEIKLPANDQDFRLTKWNNLTPSGDRILIKAGNRFINPFIQLDSYRSVLKEVISNTGTLRHSIDGSRICTLNIFTGPITLSRETPRSIPYYKLIQESELESYLYDLASPNVYNPEVATSIKSIFPAPAWDDTNRSNLLTHKKVGLGKVSVDIETMVTEFLTNSESGVLVLESMHSDQRDRWMHYILDVGIEADIPQSEVWTHSNRIARNIQKRTGLRPDSLFNSIYGGKSQIPPDSAIDAATADDGVPPREIIPISSDEEIDESATIIIHEAHLVTRSLNQSELLRFGSGRLLEDLIKFLRLDSTKRKLICIGDPYSLSYGKHEDSALSPTLLGELFSGRIEHHRLSPKSLEAKNKIDCLRIELASSIEKDLYNNLRYPLEPDILEKVEIKDTNQILQQWYGSPLLSEPDNTVLVYSNKKAHDINMWVKKSVLKNSAQLNKNDLLLAHNNVTVPDETGFGLPAKIYNGAYLLVLGITAEHSELIKVNEKSPPIQLRYIELKVRLLSHPSKAEINLWLLDNYFSSETHELSGDEEIALNILLNKKVAEKTNSHPFEQSQDYEHLLNDAEYTRLLQEERDLTERFSQGDRVKGKLDSAQVAIRKTEGKYKRIHRAKLARSIAYTDPHINAVRASYGWAVTVHKATGSSFNKIIFSATQSETAGVHNESYFRWVYTALTCAKSNVSIINPIEFDPLDGCTFEDNVIPSPSTPSGPTPMKKLAIHFDDFAVPEQFKRLIEDSLNTSALGCICEISTELSLHGITLVATKKQGDYLSKATYSVQQDMGNNLVLAIDNNNEGKVTGVRIEKNGATDKDMVNECISSAISALTRGPTTGPASELDFPSNFPGELYCLWETRCEQNGYLLHLRQRSEWTDQFLMHQDSRKISFSVSHNKAHFITYINVIEKTDMSIGEILREIIFNADQKRD